MLKKYVEERFPGYLNLSLTDGETLVHEDNPHVFLQGSEWSRSFVVSAHQELVDFIARLAEAFDEANHEAFQKFWYEDSRK